MNDNRGYSGNMTTDTETTVSTATKLRAARIRKNAFIVLFLNLTVYPLTWIIFDVAFPRIDDRWSTAPTDEAIKLSLVIAFLAAAHVGRGYEMEFSERAHNTPSLSRTRAMTQSALRMVWWTVTSIVSLAVTALFIILFRNIFVN
jgi:hypothetical protein